jgi:hypothetical protein
MHTYEFYQVLVFKERIFELYKLEGDPEYSLSEVRPNGACLKVAEAGFPPVALAKIYTWGEDH